MYCPSCPRPLASYASVTKSFFVEYLDYLEMQQKFYGKVKEKYPTHFKTEHDIITAEPMSYEHASALEKLFAAAYPNPSDTGVEYAIRLRTLQLSDTKASMFVLQAAMLYGAVVLMVICLTVLSLQQLLDAGQYRYRFSVLRKLGVEERRVRALVLQQLGVWFGLPVGTAILATTAVILYFMKTVSAEISAYIGFGTLTAQIGATGGILLLLLLSYFLCTWMLFQRSVEEGTHTNP